MRSQACNNLGPTRFIAPSPSGKAPDSDSGIGGSNPSGAAKHRRSDLTIGPFLLPDDPPRQPLGIVRTNHCRTKGTQGSAAGAPPCRNGRASAKQTGTTAGTWPPRMASPRATVHRRSGRRQVVGTRRGPCRPCEAARPGPGKTCPARPSTPRPPSAESRYAPPKRQKPGMAGLLKWAPRRTGTQQTRWISAWRTGSRDGPCADRPSYARLRGRHGS